MTAQSITQEYLKECLHYDPETGIFTWLTRPRDHFTKRNDWRSWNTRFARRQTGTVRKGGYVLIGIRLKLFYAHRLAFLYMIGEWPTHHIDHVNHDPSDNSWKNLRPATREQNMRNMKKLKKNLSGITGVSECGDGKWAATIRAEGVQTYLGRFETAQEAADARRRANEKYGFHPNHGI